MKCVKCVKWFWNNYCHDFIPLMDNIWIIAVATCVKITVTLLNLQCTVMQIFKMLQNTLYIHLDSAYLEFYKLETEQTVL